MRCRLMSICLFMLFLISSSAAIAFAEEFSAMMVNVTRDGVFEGKISVSNDKVVVQYYEGTILVRGDKNAMWFLYTKAKRYKERPYNPVYIVATTGRVPGERQRTLISKGLLNGKMTDKYQVTYEFDQKTYTVFQWFEPGLDIPIKTVTRDGGWSMEYKTISIGPQPRELFEIPPEYKEGVPA